MILTHSLAHWPIYSLSVPLIVWPSASPTHWLTIPTLSYLEKNRDSLSRDVTMLLRNSDNALIAALFKAEITTRGTFKAKKGADLGLICHFYILSYNHATIDIYYAKPSTVDCHWKFSINISRSYSDPLNIDKKKAPTTVTSCFTASLTELLTKMNAAEPHFVRCLKSNLKQASNLWVPEMVTRQVRDSFIYVYVGSVHMSAFWCDVRTNGKDEHTHIIYIQLFSYDAASLCRSDGNHSHSSCKFSSYLEFLSCYYILSVCVMYATRPNFIILCSFHPTFMCLFLPITYTYLITYTLT